jgi:hypothetical protein
MGLLAVHELDGRRLQAGAALQSLAARINTLEE